MLLAHGPIAYMLNERIQRDGISKLRRRDQILVALFSLFSGIVVDFDFFFLLNSDTPPFQHHLYYFHSLLFWIPVWIIFYLLLNLFGRFLDSKDRKIFTKEFLHILGLTFIISTASHLIADMLVGYNAMFYPWLQQFTILGEILPINYFTGHLYSAVFAIEIVLLSLFLILIIKRFFKKEKLSKYLTYTLLPLTGIYLLFAIYITLNTYNHSAHRNDIHSTYDIDMDRVADSRDLDTDNDGVNNIDDVDISQLKKDIKRVSQLNVYTDKNILFKQFGGFNSYRLISQSFFEQNNAIEPVLRDNYRKTNDNYSYSLDFSYEQHLYEYYTNKGYSSNGDLLDSDIFFILDSNNEVINLGVVIDRENIAIVMPNDNRTTLHEPRYVMDYYNSSDLYLVKY